MQYPRSFSATKALPRYYPYLTLVVFQVAVVLLFMALIDTVCGHAQDSALEGVGAALFFAIFWSCFNDLQQQKDH